MADGEYAEARAWLDPSHEGHWGFEVGLDEMRELTEAFYDAGAFRVLAVYSSLETTQISALLLVELPEDARRRRRVFATFAELAPRYEREAERDVGQGCLLLGLD